MAGRIPHDKQIAHHWLMEPKAQHATVGHTHGQAEIAHELLQPDAQPLLLVETTYTETNRLTAGKSPRVPPIHIVLVEVEVQTW